MKQRDYLTAKTDIGFAVDVREGDDCQAMGGRVPDKNECEANGELISFHLSCAALNFSERTGV